MRFNTPQIFLICFCLLCFFSCKPSPKPLPILVETVVKVIEPSPPPFDTAKHVLGYNNLKKEMKSAQSSLKKAYRQNQAQAIADSKAYLFRILTDSVFLYWYGTEWDFNGITKEPRNGEIACGYFVSTTLQDAGIHLRRYWLAQQAAADIAKNLALPSSIKTISKEDGVLDYLKNREKPGLYVLGLSFHVGFIVDDGEEVYFVHSNYSGKGVISEKFKESSAIWESDIFVIGSILENPVVLKKWLE